MDETTANPEVVLQLAKMTEIGDTSIRLLNNEDLEVELPIKCKQSSWFGKKPNEIHLSWFAYEADPDNTMAIDESKEIWYMTSKYDTAMLTNLEVEGVKFPGMIGVVSRYDWNTGNVFLDASACGGPNQVFIHSNVVARNSQDVNVGDEIAFDIHWSPTTGRPQASAPLWMKFGSENKAHDDPALGAMEDNMAVADPFDRTNWTGPIEWSKYRMGTLTADKTPDGNHTVMLTLEQDMIFCDDAVLDKYQLVTGADIACAVYTDESGHPLLDEGHPIFELSASFKENQTPFFGDFVGEVQTVSPHGNAFIRITGWNEETQEFRVQNELKDYITPPGQRKPNRDCFVHQNVVFLCEPQQGDIVVFAVHVSASGAAQVSCPIWFRCKKGGRQMTGIIAGGGKGKGKGGMNRSEPYGVPSEIDLLNPVIGKPTKGKGGKQTKGGKGKSTTITLESIQQGISAIPCSADSNGPRLTHGIAEFVVNGSFVGPIHQAQIGDGYETPDGFVLRGHILHNLEDTAQFTHIGQFEGIFSHCNQMGHGYIKCAETEQMHLRDVFVHSSIVERAVLLPGDVVKFNIHVNKEGCPQCSAPMWVKFGNGVAPRFNNTPIKGKGAVAKGLGRASTVSLPAANPAPAARDSMQVPMPQGPPARPPSKQYAGIII